MTKNIQYGNPGVYRETPVNLQDGEPAALSVNERGEVIVDGMLDLGATVFDLPNADALGVAVVDDNGDQLTSFPITEGLSLPPYDYVSMALSSGDTTETYTFKVGGASGTTVATVTVVYTTSAREVLSSVTKT